MVCRWPERHLWLPSAPPQPHDDRTAAGQNGSAESKDGGNERGGQYDFPSFITLAMLTRGKSGVEAVRTPVMQPRVHALVVDGDPKPLFDPELYNKVDLPIVFDEEFLLRGDDGKIKGITVEAAKLCYESAYREMVEYRALAYLRPSLFNPPTIPSIVVTLHDSTPNGWIEDNTGPDGQIFWCPKFWDTEMQANYGYGLLWSGFAPSQRRKVYVEEEVEAERRV